MVSTPNQKYRRANDPYNAMEEAIIRPTNIARQLSEAEEGASAQSEREGERPLVSEQLARSLRDSEQNQRSTNLTTSLDDFSDSRFRNSVTGHNAKSKKQGNKKGKKSGKGPIATFLISLAAFGGLFGAASSTLGANITALYAKATNVQFSSYHLRSARVFKYMLDGGNQIKISRFTKRYTTFTPYMKKRLAKNGIEVGYIDSTGKFRTDQILANHSTVLRYKGETISANDFTAKYASDMNFQKAYTNAKRGRVAGFFDASAERFYKKKGQTRDTLDQFKSTGDAEQNTEEWRKTVTDNVGSVDGTIDTAHHERNEETGEDEVKNSGEKTDTSKIQGDAEVKARALATSIASKVSDVAVPVCTVLRVANIIAITASAIQTARAIAYFHSIMEPLSKAMAGEGSTSAINETLNFLTTPVSTEVETTDENGNEVTKTVYGSPLESSGSKVKLGNTITNVKEAADYTTSSITRAATTIAISTGATNTACAGAMAASAIVSLASIAIPGGALAKFVIGAIVQTAGGIAITWAVSALISAVTPYLARILISDVFEKYTGVPAGQLWNNGDSASNMQLATSGSGYMPASQDRVDTQNDKYVVALREEAALDRYGRSPFDATSTNTFLGSLLSQFSFAAYTHNPGTMISTLASSFGKSVKSLTPAASAYSKDVMYTSIYQPCEFMPEATCDMYGTPIVATDYSTIETQPDDATYEAVLAPNLEYDSQGNEKVKKNSELAKFINFCVNRESPWGVKDANILNALQTDGGIILNNMPIVNDILDVINAAEDVANEDWATGANCLNSSSNSRWDSEMKYYQRYVEDMRILNGMTDDKETKNPVVAYEEEYEAEHPIDTSYEGTLARLSGQTKEDIHFALAFAEYSNQLAEYNPAERYFFGEEPAEQPDVQIEESDFAPNFATIIDPISIFIDKRNYLV